MIEAPVGLDHTTLLLVGPPGCGKSMLAQRLAGILPELTAGEALDVATVASVARAMPAAVTSSLAASGLRVQRPFRAPHHTSSAASIIGGGSRAQPGEITLADHGVLFLDELPEFDRRVLEALREPLETGMVAISRAGTRAEYPARFQLVAAMNPCPCGYLGDARRPCHCTPPQIAQYRGRISGPLLDRIDLRVSLSAERGVSHGPGTAIAALGESPPVLASSAEWRARVAAARKRQMQRAGRLNAALSVQQLPQAAAVTGPAHKLLANLREQLALSLRAEHRLLRVARTVADLAATEQVDLAHIAEAQQLRRALDTAAAQSVHAASPG